MRTPLLALALLAAPCPAQFTPAQIERFDAVLGAAVGRNKTVGLVVGLRLGELQWTRGYGVTIRKGGAVPDADTLFEIGSISKVFTGLLLAELVESGAVKLDDSLQSLLPAHVTVPTGEDHSIRLVDLSTHRSGLPRMPSNFRPKNGKDPYADYDAELLYDFLAEHRLRREPGSEYEYSNLGTGLLGHALARAAEVPFDEALRTRVLVPLGMADSRVQRSGVELPDAGRVSPVHDGLGRPTEAWFFDVLAGCGAVRSSVNDMMRFIDCNLGIADLGENGERWSAILARAREVHAEGGGPKVGLGWHFRDGSVPGVWHNGQTGGSAAHLALDVERQIGVVILTNTSRKVDDLAGKLLEILAQIHDG